MLQKSHGKVTVDQLNITPEVDIQMALGNGQSSNSTESEKYNNNLSLKKTIGSYLIHMQLTVQVLIFNPKKLQPKLFQTK